MKQGEFVHQLVVFLVDNLGYTLEQVADRCKVSYPQITRYYKTAPTRITTASLKKFQKHFRAEIDNYRQQISTLDERHANAIIALVNQYERLYGQFERLEDRVSELEKKVKSFKKPPS